MSDEVARAVTPLDRKGCINEILRAVLRGDACEYRTGDGYVRWGLVERRLYELVDDIPDLLADRAEAVALLRRLVAAASDKRPSAIVDDARRWLEG